MAWPCDCPHGPTPCHRHIDGASEEPRPCPVLRLEAVRHAGCLSDGRPGAQRVGFHAVLRGNVPGRVLRSGVWMARVKCSHVPLLTCGSPPWKSASPVERIDSFTCDKPLIPRRPVEAPLPGAAQTSGGRGAGPGPGGRVGAGSAVGTGDREERRCAGGRRCSGHVSRSGPLWGAWGGAEGNEGGPLHSPRCRVQDRATSGAS